MVDNTPVSLKKKKAGLPVCTCSFDIVVQASPCSLIEDHYNRTMWQHSINIISHKLSSCCLFSFQQFNIFWILKLSNITKNKSSLFNSNYKLNLYKNVYLSVICWTLSSRGSFNETQSKLNYTKINNANVYHEKTKGLFTPQLYSETTCKTARCVGCINFQILSSTFTSYITLPPTAFCSVI